MQERYAFLAQRWEQSRKDFGSQWEVELSENAQRVFGFEPNPRWDEAVNGYAEFAIDSMRAQFYFEKHGKYMASSYAECLAQCYHDPEYMTVHYLPGQFLSHFVWPHHHRMLNHYTRELLPKIREKVSTFYEVGVGCGMYSLKTLQALPKACGTGIDISEYSLAFTHRIIQDNGLDSRYTILNTDILSAPPETQADLVISQEVLEHLENPDVFVKGLYDLTRPGGYGYITAAVKAAHTDHIFLYHTPEEVMEHLIDAGWKILESFVEETEPKKPLEFRPTVAGYLCIKES